MDLKKKAANAWEAREARETAVAASKQGQRKHPRSKIVPRAHLQPQIVLVFTVVTIIFLPLSFMSAFFMIGISTFSKDKVSGETSWPMGLVTAILCKPQRSIFTSTYLTRIRSRSVPQRVLAADRLCLEHGLLLRHVQRTALQLLRTRLHQAYQSLATYGFTQETKLASQGLAREAHKVSRAVSEGRN